MTSEEEAQAHWTLNHWQVYYGLNHTLSNAVVWISMLVKMNRNGPHDRNGGTNATG